MYADIDGIVLKMCHMDSHYMNMCDFMGVYIYPHSRTHTHAHSYICIYTCTYVFVYTYIHTHWLPAWRNDVAYHLLLRSTASSRYILQRRSKAS